MYGGFSVENFQGTQNNLSLTHESTEGFLNYLRQWYECNFHYRDQDVAAWAFHDDGRDNLYQWRASDGYDYGLDAVRVAGIPATAARPPTAPTAPRWAATGAIAVGTPFRAK